MDKVEFKAKFAHASIEKKDNYYLVGLAEDEFDYEKYILFQKPYKFGKNDNPNAKSNGIYVECNGDSCFNCCKEIRINHKNLTLVVQESQIIIDIENVDLPKNFVEYLKGIFGDLLQINMEQSFE
ncbi:Imm10 family immunity protein [Pedobacter caeni]|uniref:Immunity protein 10 n=1 Tax=Pedobacter caeni TaxID=288992 RepID=A0A1M4VHV7_9SPHI|nr:Imm10 family immunity protein [Pedobacter caeni]SHE68559.1 Immunity protein 10 [Pedobacter caeni]